MAARSLKSMKDAAGQLELLSEADAKRTVAYVNRGRMILAQSVRDLRLFDPDGTPSPNTGAKVSDHPLLQCIYALKRELASMPSAAEADDKDRANRLKAVVSIADLVQTATTEAHKASTEIQGLIARKEDFAQRQKEHEDKMRVSLSKTGGSDPTDAELEAMAAADADVIPHKDSP